MFLHTRLLLGCIGHWIRTARDAPQNGYDNRSQQNQKDSGGCGFAVTQRVHTLKQVYSQSGGNKSRAAAGHKIGGLKMPYPKRHRERYRCYQNSSQHGKRYVPFLLKNVCTVNLGRLVQCLGNIQSGGKNYDHEISNIDYGLKDNCPKCRGRIAQPVSRLHTEQSIQRKIDWAGGVVHRDPDHGYRNGGYNIGKKKYRSEKMPTFWATGENHRDKASQRNLDKTEARGPNHIVCHGPVKIPLGNERHVIYKSRKFHRAYATPLGKTCEQDEEKRVQKKSGKQN